jgi:excisionase family DNA binding protein
METFGFDKLPEVVRQLFEKVERIEALLEKMQTSENETDKPLSIEEAATYLNITIAALYSMTSRRLVPFSKPGKRLYFLRKDLDAWINQAKNRTHDEIMAANKHRFRL